MKRNSLATLKMLIQIDVKFVGKQFFISNLR
jgi:hypothetical protein